MSLVHVLHKLDHIDPIGLGQYGTTLVHPWLGCFGEDQGHILDAEMHVDVSKRCIDKHD